MSNCCLCDNPDLFSRMTPLRWERFRVLRHVLNGVQGPCDWVHPQCLAKWGLHPMPESPQTNVWELMHAAVTAHLLRYMRGNRDVTTPETLMTLLTLQMRADLPMLTQQGSNALIRVIRRWVPFALLLNVHFDTEHTVRGCIAQTEASSRRISDIDFRSAMKKLHIKRVPEARDVPMQVAPKPRKVAVDVNRGRYSVSHAMVDRLHQTMRHVPQPNAVIACVREWFLKRQKNPVLTKLDVRQFLSNNQWLAYGWPRGHPRAFQDTTYEHQLWVHVHQTFCHGAPPPPPPRTGIRKYF